MLRAFRLCLALSVVVVALLAVSSAEPPAPAGPRLVHVLVRNETPLQVEVDGLTRTGRPSGVVLPTSVEAGSTADMTWSIPIADYWAIVVNGSAIDGSLTRKMRQECTPEIEVTVKAMMEISFGCKPAP